VQMPIRSLRKPSRSLAATLAENIRRIRREKTFSQERLAEICGLHRTYVGSVERGERNVSLSSLEAFSSALGVSVAELLTKREATDAETEEQVERLC
jgi:transcriptional regulator with XRE-family HTH domain